MSESIKGVVFNALTGEILEKTLDESEVANLQQIQEEALALESEAQAKADAKASALAKLAALGLTEEEIAAL